MVTNTFGKTGGCDAKVAMMQNKLLVRQCSNVYPKKLYFGKKIVRKLNNNIYNYCSTKEHSSKLH